MDELLDTIRTEFRSMPLRELLSRSPRVLLGVTAEAEATLAALEIGTVFDLATSAVFEAATKLVQADDVASAFFKHGRATADLVREDAVAGRDVDELQLLDVGVLEAIPAGRVADVKQALDVTTVRDLALYPPYRTASRLLTELYFPENARDFDPERPSDLLPKNGEYPTERVQYTTLLMDAIQPDGRARVLDVADPRFRPLDLTALAAGDAGFKHVAYGALLTFNQSWYAQGVTLGQLLHSTSLAPGESTRVAVVDWSRKSRAGETEAIDQTEDLTNDTDRNRSISEVTEAVADEAQGGFSTTNSTSGSTQRGAAASAEMSAPFGGLFGGPSGSIGFTSSEATTAAHADSYSTSWGHRHLGSTMLQNVNDRTHQHAHSARSRRASVVKEVAQSEHADVSTRVIANYNHMHALTVQYYEVVQIYRVEVSIARADRVVFIPLALLAFRDDAIVRRFRSALARAALTYEIRQALERLDVVELTPEPDTHFTTVGGPLKAILRDPVALRRLTVASAADGAAVTTAKERLARRSATAADAERAAAAPPTPPPTPTPTVVPVVQRISERLWSAPQAARLSGLLGRPVLGARSSAIQLPNDVSVEGAASDGETPTPVVFHTVDGGSRTDVSPSDPLALTQVTRIGLTGANPDRDMSVTVTLTLNRNGVRFPLELPAVTVPKGAAQETRVVTVRAGGVDANLQQHLAANRLHYSQAVFRSLDSAQIAWLLAGHGIEVNGEVVPIAQVVDPRPVRYVGNYLAFKITTDPAQDRSWAQWLADHGVELGSTSADLVPLPAGGTFAEAILGRSNCAEQLDPTRFWNWQDSPIPLQPTEIAAIDTGSRVQAEDVTPGQLGSPSISISAPAAAPDPAGTAAVLTALQNGAMFRDMSGLQATIGMAQAALQATSSGAATAGQQAGRNMESLLRANTERQRIAAEMITELAKTAASAYTGGLAGGGGGRGGSGGSHSEDGAMINYFDRTRDGRTAADGAGDAGRPASGGGSGAPSGGPAGTAGGAASGDGFSRNPAALAATWGDGAPRSELLDRLVGTLASEALGNGTASSSSALTARRAWPRLDPTTVLTRIEALRGNADLFDQGALGLCTAAAFFHHVIQHRPEAFASFARALYGAGLGFLGRLRVAPDGDLREADYAGLAARIPRMPPQADWMLMSSLRDSENWFFDFEGAPEEDVAIETAAREMEEWYAATGMYRDVRFSDDTSLAAIRAIEKRSDNQVALWVQTSLIQEAEADSRHIITLESPIRVDDATATVQLRYWTWAEPVRTLSVALPVFQLYYLGAITARL